MIRVTNRNYSTPGGTPSNYQASPNVTYTYGTTAPKVGKLTKVDSSVSTTEYTGFDILGRVTGHKQTTDGTDYTTAYMYKLNGALDEETYPSTRVVKNVLNGNGDLAMVESKKTSASGYWSYADSFTYNPAGAVTSMQLGNGRWESTTFNSRLQPTQIALGTLQNGFDQLKLQYSYGDWNSGSVDATKNSGNIVQQVIAVPTVGASTGFVATQKYYYDSLNRIDDATEDLTPTGGSSVQTWRQDFSYDRYGNRNFVEANTTTIPRACGTSPSFTICTADHKKYNPGINSANDNRINTSDGYGFDSSGNTTGDSEGRTFIYDGENKQVEVKDSSNQTIGQYTYDGDGKRIKKYVPDTGETTVFVYDAAGRQVAEYSTIVANSTDAKVAYLTSDHLGSPRINTDANGAVIARHDYHPFGEEIASSQRVTGLGYSEDTIRKQFTGYERDNETDLDFAQARIYSKTVGRFFSTDPANGGGTGDDPQDWNAYSYSRNNPLIFSDPSGRDYQLCNTNGECVTVSDSEFKNAQKQLPSLYVQTDEHGHYDQGNILNEDGSQLGTYQRVSIDPEYRLVYGVADAAPRKIKVVGALAAGAVVVGACIALCPVAAATVGTAIATRLGARIGAEALEKAAERVISNPNTLNHIFDAKHLLEPLVQQLGSQRAVVTAVVSALAGKLPADGVFKVSVSVSGQTVEVTGKVIDGIVKVSNFWVP